MLNFTGERIVPGAPDCEPFFAEKMYQEHLARYLLAAQAAAGAHILDVGCGVGYGSRLLAEAGAAKVVAFDLSADAIAHARENFAHPNIDFQVGNATAFRFDRRFELITCFELIEHVPDQEAVFRCIAEALSPDGIVVMSTPRALAEKRTSFHTQEYSLGAFADAFRRHFAHHRLLVENNHFASLITDATPNALHNVRPMHDQFALEQADYFIAVATQGNPALLDRMQPVITLNNDAYVQLLERDANILQARRIELERDADRLQRRLDELEREHRKVCDSLTQRDTELGRSRHLQQQAEVEAAHTGELLRAMTGSLSWRVTAPLRTLSLMLQRSVPAVALAARYHRRHGGRATLRRARQRLMRPNPDPSPAQAQFAPPVEQGVAAAPGMPQPEILILIGCLEGESKRYRVHNLAAALRQGGRQVEILPFAAINRIAAERIRPQLVVLFRASDEPCMPAYFQYAKANGIRTVYDVDDLVFDPAVVPTIHGYQQLSAEDKPQYRDGVTRYRALLRRCDLVTVPTEPLARAAAALGIAAAVVPNTWNEIQGGLAERLLLVPKPSRQDIVIGYFSGSRTHDKDFVEARPALLRLMDQRPEVRLRIVGELNAGPGFTRFGDRVERIAFQPYQEMLRVLHACDINIAPLELGNAFNESKSVLKWFEAALVEVPTIASATEPYRTTIEHGRTGFVVANEADWDSALAMLCDSPALRQSVGAAARSEAVLRFGPAQMRAAAEAAYHLPAAVTRPSRTVATDTSTGKRIDWIVPGLIIGSGGHRNILRAAHFLERFGHDVGLHFTDTELSARQLREQLNRHFYPFKGEVRRYDGILRYSDVLFATHWSTVAPALQSRGLTREVMYFVQDFEPWFAPMGSEYIMAENTYRQGLYCITSGLWCERFLRRDFDAEADHFDFPLDRSVYFPRVRRKKETNVVFFAKPEMPRRCYELGIQMLRELHRRMPGLEIVMFGSRNVDTGSLGFPVTLRAVLPTIADLAQMYADGDLGIVFSTTNPSLVPYEMMACGLPVVDLGRPGNEANYADRFDIALLADPEPSRMADQVHDLLGRPDELAARVAAGLELVAGMPDEEQMARQVEKLILDRLAR